MTEIKEITEDLKIDVEAIPCSCGGYCDKVPGTAEERKKYGCGRNFDCCNVAFLCRVCKTRWVGRLPAPEMDY